MDSLGPGPPSTSPPVGPPTEEQCGVFWSHNQTKYDFTGGEYGEIPFTLIINSIGWVVLILLFAILRKIAWDYGRIALVSRTEENTQVLKKGNGYNVWTSLFFGERDKPAHGSQESLDTHLHSQDK
ncbi:calcium permeable stress-gated cation channel 1-like, partial [Ylistrum balloti]|uniref:calcium permeable stress-gated cation channel 1-like n=1 Tax=Ylistrum balloti TaxID=509963 RepID=UPI0029058FDD